MEDRGTSSGWPTNRPPGRHHKHQICFGPTVHSQTDGTGRRLTSGADSRRAETRMRVLETRGNSVSLATWGIWGPGASPTHRFRAADKEDLEGSLQVLLQLGLGDTLKVQKRSQMFFFSTSELVYGPFLCAYRLLEVDLIVKDAQVSHFLQSGIVDFEQRRVERRHGSARTRRDKFRQKPLNVSDGGATAPPSSPDSLWVKLSHVPNQGAAPVVTHQGDLWDRLEKRTEKRWTVTAGTDQTGFFFNCLRRLCR